MTSRILPRDEYARLAGTELEPVMGLLPESARVIVVEEDGQIVGCWALISVLHAEGLWVHPGHRGRASVGRRLLRGLRETARDLGATTVATAATSCQVEAMLDAIGAKELPGTHFVMGV